jgi:hypothetical protein
MNASARAINNLVLLRLNGLCDIIRHELDPALFWAPYNDAGDAELPDNEHDIRFEEWPKTTVVRRARGKTAL